MKVALIVPSVGGVDLTLPPADENYYLHQLLVTGPESDKLLSQPPFPPADLSVDTTS